MKVTYIAPKVYSFSGWLFEDCPASGPWPLRKDFTRRSTAGAKFFDVYSEFRVLPEYQKEQCRVCPHAWSYTLEGTILCRSCKHCGQTGRVLVEQKDLDSLFWGYRIEQSKQAVEVLGLRK